MRQFNLVLKCRVGGTLSFRKGRLCCLFELDSFTIIFVFEELNGNKVTQEWKLQIDMSNMRAILEETEQQGVYSVKENIENVYKKIRPLLILDLENRCLTTSNGLVTITVSLRTISHP